jgi:hypothetical protein
MGVDSKHPLFVEFETDWLQMRETYRGQRVVKEAGAKYLPPTSGMVADGIKSPEAEGYKAYVAYRARAEFPEFVRQAVDASLGVMHHKPAVFELPPQLEPLIERATVKGESLQALLRRINEEQLVTGRLGLLIEVPTGPGEQQPYIAFYRGEDVINWDSGASDLTLESLNLVVLNESEFERETKSAGDFEWEYVRKYRVLVLGEVGANEPEGTYRVGVFRDQDSAGRARQEGEAVGTEFTEEALIEPSIGGKTALELPFVFVNAKDIVPDPDEPPLLGVSNKALTFYRGSADYRQALFMQGQDTLVVMGHVSEGTGKPMHRIGAGASIDVPIGGDAKFIGVESSGLEEMRMAQEGDKRDAGALAGRLLEDDSREKESGEALKVRVAARTATLNSIALAGAGALQELLRKLARWVGADPEAVVVTPNLDFTDDTMTGDELGKLMGAKTMGAPIAMETIHKNMEDRGMTDLTFEEEIAKMQEEKSIDVLQPPEPATEDGSPEDDAEGDKGGDKPPAGGGGKPAGKPPAKKPAKADA